MKEFYLLSFTGLTAVQVLLYKPRAVFALKNYWFLGLFYFSVFTFTKGLIVFSTCTHISFYEPVLFCLVLFILLGRKIKVFPTFIRHRGESPNFYLLSGLWLGFLWFQVPELRETELHLSEQGSVMVTGLLWSFFTALLLPVLAGIRERLDLLDVPAYFEGTPIFLFAVGILTLILTFF